MSFNNVTVHNPETLLCQQVLLACERGKFENFEEFLENNDMHIDESDSNGSTALHFAVAQNNVKCVKILLKHDACPNIKDNQGFTPFAFSAGRYASPAMAEVLILNGADINVKNNCGNTPLHSVVCSQDIHVLQLLMKLGANRCIKNNKDQTAMDLAEAVESISKVDMLSVLKSCFKSVCDHCSQKAGKNTKLKMCTGCKQAQYCSKECQKLDWKYGHKQLCSGYILTSMALKNASASDLKKLSKKKFIVKVQLPLNLAYKAIAGDMMVYNKNKSFQHLLRSSNQERSFKLIEEKITKDGLMGVKAYFWAEIDTTCNNRVKIYYREPTLFQDW